MGTLTLLVAIIDQINRYVRNFLLRKFGQDETGTALIAWEKVCKPKTQGGLVVLDVSLHNKTL